MSEEDLAPLDAPVVPAAVEPMAATSGEDPSALRKRLHDQFDLWIDRMFQESLPPEGLPEELLAAAANPAAPAAGLGCDLYTLFSALTALTGETRLQGRTFKQLTETIAPMAEVPQRIERMESMQAAMADQFQQLAEQVTQEQDAQPGLPGTKETLQLVFDVHGRLLRQVRLLDEVTTAASRPLPLLARWSAGSAISRITQSTASLCEGAKLTLSRLEAALQQWGIEPIGEVGEAFDPQRMTAIEVQSSAEAEDGEVLEVFRLGYERYGQVLATAQVKVARNKLEQ